MDSLSYLCMQVFMGMERCPQPLNGSYFLLISGLFNPFTILSTTTNSLSLENNCVSVLKPYVLESKLGSNFLKFNPIVETYASLLSLVLISKALLISLVSTVTFSFL